MKKNALFKGNLSVAMNDLWHRFTCQGDLVVSTTLTNISFIIAHPVVPRLVYLARFCVHKSRQQRIQIIFFAVRCFQTVYMGAVLYGPAVAFEAGKLTNISYNLLIIDTYYFYQFM